MEKLRLLWLSILMDIKAFHRPQLMVWLKIQMWDLPWLHVNSYYFTCEHVLVEVSLLFFHYLTCGVYGENHLCEADRTPGLPFLRLIVCVGGST